MIINGDCHKIIPTLETNSIDLVILDPVWENLTQIDLLLLEECKRVLKVTGSLYILTVLTPKIKSLIWWYYHANKIFEFQDMITWKKRRGYGSRRGWLKVSEYLLWFSVSNKYKWNKQKQYSKELRVTTSINNLSDYKRWTNVWTDISEMSPNCWSNAIHPYQKPEEYIERIVELHTNEGDMVLDGFFGSGTTGIVCNKLKRKWIGIEIDLEYCKIAKQRINEGD